MTEESKNPQVPQTTEKACDPSFTRAEFVKRVVKGAALTGGLIAAPKILDKFLIPPAFAGASTCGGNGTATTNGGPGPDTVQTFPLPFGPSVQCTNNPGTISPCASNNDATAICT